MFTALLLRLLCDALAKVGCALLWRALGPRRCPAGSQARSGARPWSPRAPDVHATVITRPRTSHAQNAVGTPAKAISSNTLATILRDGSRACAGKRVIEHHPQSLDTHVNCRFPATGQPHIRSAERITTSTNCRATVSNPMTLCVTSPNLFAWSQYFWCCATIRTQWRRRRSGHDGVVGAPDSVFG